MTRIPIAEHTNRPWRIHAIAPDFDVEDVWAFDAPGSGADDFAVLLAALRANGGFDNDPPIVKLLFAIRWKLGELFGWDDVEQGLAGRVTSLRDRLPPDLRRTVTGAAVPTTPFIDLYELPDEYAMELANKTVHAVAHFGWVPVESGEYQLRMAALVKANGVLGRLYMLGIKPFRYLIVYPALTHKWEHVWLTRQVTSGRESERLRR